LHQISTDYFRALGTPLRAGRAFANTDHASAPPVVVVNEELARHLWPGEPASGVIGRVIPLGSAELTVVGVVGNIHQHSLAEAPQAAMYLHALQNFRSRMSIVVRTSGDPLAHIENVKKAIWSLEPNQTITSTATLASVLGSEVARPRLLAWLLALFGFIGLTLGALGIFGVLAFAVNQRRQEIGVRVALGATPRTVLALVVGGGMLLTLAGVAAGLMVAALVTRSMQSVLYGIEASDPLTFVQVAAVLLAAALLASWIPARRALNIDPVTALRYD
jgi:predicted permease